ncbi:MAG: hypothetical protein ACREAN_04915, partial [Nitrosopumilaceae archaeon]
LGRRTSLSQTSSEYGMLQGKPWMKLDIIGPILGRINLMNSKMWGHALCDYDIRRASIIHQRVKPCATKFSS